MSSGDIYDLACSIKFIPEVIGIIGVLPYVIWMIVTACKRRWKKLLKQIIIPCIIFGFSNVASYSLFKISQRLYYQELFDTKVSFSEPMFEYDSHHGFLGDGYSLTVYELPDSIHERFSVPDRVLTNAFPKVDKDMADWNIVCWHKSPLDQEFKEYLDFAVYSPEMNDLSEMGQYSMDLRKALESDETYYSFFTKSHGFLDNVTMFVVDLGSNRVYMIYNDT